MGGELDLAAAEPLRQALETEMSAGRDVLLDLGGVAFIDCSGLSSVMAGIEAAQAQGRRLDIDANLSEPVRHVAGLTSTLDQLPLLRW